VAVFMEYAIFTMTSHLVTVTLVSMAINVSLERVYVKPLIPKVVVQTANV